MNDETRKALDKIFSHSHGKITPMGASSMSGLKEGEPPVAYVGMFMVHGNSLDLLRQLYDDAIAADDAAKLAADKAAADKAAQDKGDE